jgi:DNA ligase-associated metallophosphoesterase
MSESVSLHIEDATLILRPERAVIWHERRTVIVADTHFGKSALFRRNGVAVPDGSDELARKRLEDLIRVTASKRLLILGDFLHAPIAKDSREAAALESWCYMLKDVQIAVVAGNHDRGALTAWRPPLQWYVGELLEPPFRFTHDADHSAHLESGLYTLSGHIHPVTRLGPSRTRAPRIPVFWERRQGLVLPSFGLFTGGSLVNPNSAGHIYAAGPERVVRLR